MRVSLVCVAKNEDRYVEEWVDYHTKIGFDEIVMYQNDWTCGLERENLKKLRRDGTGQQVHCYNQYLSEVYSSKDTDWVAFLDVDEFLVLKRHTGVKEFLENYNDSAAVGINWYFFGNSGLKEAGEGLIKRFKLRSRNMNRHVKSIVNVRVCSAVQAFMRDPHALKIPWTDTSGRLVTGPFNERPDSEVAQINHYWAKTVPEFQEKISRGRATCSFKRTMREYDGNLLRNNEVEDLLAYEFMYGERGADRSRTGI
jgi:hypothetical protein